VAFRPLNHRAPKMLGPSGPEPYARRLTDGSRISISLLMQRHWRTPKHSLPIAPHGSMKMRIRWRLVQSAMTCRQGAVNSN
jgi:hypothetical protein